VTEQAGRLAADHGNEARLSLKGKNMAKPVFEACVKTGTYKKNGEDKPRWLKIGTVFEGDKGYSMLLECVPVGVQSPVWVSLFPIREKNNAAPSENYDDTPAF